MFATILATLCFWALAHGIAIPQSSDDFSVTQDSSTLEDTYLVDGFACVNDDSDPNTDSISARATPPDFCDYRLAPVQSFCMWGFENLTIGVADRCLCIEKSYSCANEDTYWPVDELADQGDVMRQQAAKSGWLANTTVGRWLAVFRWFTTSVPEEQRQGHNYGFTLLNAWAAVNENVNFRPVNLRYAYNGTGIYLSTATCD